MKILVFASFAHWRKFLWFARAGRGGEGGGGGGYLMVCFRCDSGVILCNFQSLWWIKLCKNENLEKTQISVHFLQKIEFSQILSRISRGFHSKFGNAKELSPANCYPRCCENNQIRINNRIITSTFLIVFNEIAVNSSHPGPERVVLEQSFCFSDQSLLNQSFCFSDPHLREIYIIKVYVLWTRINNKKNGTHAFESFRKCWLTYFQR